MAAFSRGWTLPFTPTPFRLPICRRCIVRVTTQQKRTLTHRTSSIKPRTTLQNHLTSKNRRNASSRSDSTKATPLSEPRSSKKHASTKPRSSAAASEAINERARAALAQMDQNPALITPYALASNIPKSGQILYEAPSQRRYSTVAFCVGAIFFFVAGGAVFIRETELEPYGGWVQFGNSFGILFSLGAGGYAIAGTMGHCRRITAFPAAKARDGLRVVLEGYYFWMPWRRRIVEADLRHLEIESSMASYHKGTKRRIELPDDEISRSRLIRFGREVGLHLREIPNACFHWKHPTLLVRPGKKGENAKFKLDITGHTFGGPKGESIARVAMCS
jgi:hypothetical protein